MEKSQDRKALETIVTLLEPLGWKCPEHSCQGCEFEAGEALITAMNAIAGIDLMAHWGPALKMNMDKPEGWDEARKIRRVAREKAWLAVGFERRVSESGEETWHRGTAC